MTEGNDLRLYAELGDGAGFLCIKRYFGQKS